MKNYLSIFTGGGVVLSTILKIENVNNYLYMVVLLLTIFVIMLKIYKIMTK